MGLKDRFGTERVFNTPLSEQGIAGFAAGLASSGLKPVAEIQFADYIFPAFDQLVNEIAKYRYRSGNQFDVGNLTLRAPCGAVGHGALYHSQSPEAYFSHTPGLKIVIPRSPHQAKGLLLSSIKENNPIIFLEPKALYRSSIQLVPDDYYELPIGVADIIKEGDDLTVVGWGSQLYILDSAIQRFEKEYNVTCELIDLRSILPWDAETILRSVKKTGRLVIAHEAPLTGGFAAEIAAFVQEKGLYYLKAPIQRVCGWDTPFGLIYEPFYVPGVRRCIEAFKEAFES